MGGVFLLFSFKQLPYAILSIAISFGFLLLTEFTDFRLIDNPNNSPEFSVYKYYVCLFTGISMILFYLFYYMRLYFDSENKLRKFIDKLNKRNNTLRKTNSELDSFVYRASHDLRAPLASLMALVKLSKEETDQSLLSEYILHQEKAIQKLDAYIVDILNISKNSRKDLEVAPVNLKGLFEDLLSQYAFLENYEQIQKIIEIEEIIPLYTDQKRLIVILNNLISNALRYSDPEKKHRYIELRAIIDKKRAIIFIKDNGIGIEKKHLDNVFEMFYRASHSSEGSGLGLYLVHETVLKLGGSVSVNSEEKGWTEFSIILPNLIAN
jgi:signal transduction histidine kinase